MNRINGKIIESYIFIRGKVEILRKKNINFFQKKIKKKIKERKRLKSSNETDYSENSA